MEDKKKKNVHVGHRKRQRDKFRQIGFSGWSEVEVLEYMLYNVYRQGDTNEVAHNLLQYNAHNIVELMRNVEDETLMSEIPGVGEKTIQFLRSLKEFINFYRRQELQYNPIKYHISNIPEIVKYIEFDPSREIFVMLCVDGQGKIRAIINLTTYGGDLSASTTKAAITRAISFHRARGIVFVHNHPTGNPTPSYHDILVTSKIETLLANEQTVVLDHIIVSGNKATSIILGREFVVDLKTGEQEEADEEIKHVAEMLDLSLGIDIDSEEE